MLHPLPISRQPLLFAAAMLLLAGAAAQNDKVISSFPPPMEAPPSGFANTVLSPAGAMLLAEFYDLGRNIRKTDTDLIERFGLVRQCRSYYVPATLDLAHPYVRGEFRQWRIRVLRQRSQSLSVLIPVHRLEEFSEADVVARINIALPAHLTRQ